MHRFYFFDRQPVRDAVDPRRLQFHRVFEGPPSFLSQRDELSSPVMRIDLECDETLFEQVVDDPLHVLTIGTEVAPLSWRDQETRVATRLEREPPWPLCD